MSVEAFIWTVTLSSVAGIVLCAIIAYSVGYRRGRNPLGCGLIGLTFGPLGIVFVMLLHESVEVRLSKEQAWKEHQEQIRAQERCERQRREPETAAEMLHRNEPPLEDT